MVQVAHRAAEAMREAIARVSWYADPEGHDLRHALSARHGVAAGEVCLAGGIDELLGLTVRVLVQPGTAVVSSLGGYPTFAYHVAGYGGELHRVPYRGDHEDLQGLAAKAHETGAALVYLANPDNPMGSWHDADWRDDRAGIRVHSGLSDRGEYLPSLSLGREFTVDSKDQRGHVGSVTDPGQARCTIRATVARSGCLPRVVRGSHAREQPAQPSRNRRRADLSLSYIAR